MDVMTKNNGFTTSSEWKQKGDLIQVYNRKIFTIDTGGDHENCLIILHGFLTSSYDYNKILPELSKHYRVIIQDFIGFGFSDKLENKYLTIIDQTDYLLQLWKILDLKNITILAHDYGALVAKELLARQNSYITHLDIDKIIFCNGSMPLDQSYFLDTNDNYKNEVSKNMVTMLNSFGVYKKSMRKVFYNESLISDDELKVLWKLLEHNNGRDIINFTSNYIRERKIFWNRWVNALNETQIPVKLILSKKDNDTLEEDNIVKLITDKLTNNKTFWIEKSGHYPMLESPKRLIECILSN
ncbi:alpha/beta fold hydrolase [Polaribacter ponticola]|uniref:Alpha/beta fold hydrolase n=1 Tax=Polaribacter ponticola TaxID=2978475 RepID=A0ABT5S769_9FLAO|nr:alpha/beta fold hydrolase [Polaribacter sp. MSW5]MDD7913943.1 alpha/beta fold hydrolase [Polaribacter sp. MSW5]